MRGLVAAVLSIAFGVVALGIPARATDKLPMNFILRYEAPAENCGAKCRLLVVATGFITAETPSQFALFANAHDLTEGDCGAQLRRWFGTWGHRFGRAIRQLGLDTTVGRVIDLKKNSKYRAS